VGERGTSEPTDRFLSAIRRVAAAPSVPLFIKIGINRRFFALQLLRLGAFFKTYSLRVFRGEITPTRLMCANDLPPRRGIAFAFSYKKTPTPR
jgi:hypothetical protein